MLNYEVRIIPKKNCEGKVYYTAFFPAIKAVIGGGYTEEDALKDAQENLEFYLEYLKDEKREFPREYSENVYNGKIALRVSKTTHQKLAEIAENEDISINLLINNAIENYLGIKEYEYQSNKIQQIHDMVETNNKIGIYNLSLNLLNKDIEHAWTDRLQILKKN